MYFEYAYKNEVLKLLKGGLNDVLNALEIIEGDLDYLNTSPTTEASDAFTPIVEDEEEHIISIKDSVLIPINDKHKLEKELLDLWDKATDVYIEIIESKKEQEQDDDHYVVGDNDYSDRVTPIKPERPYR